jgi:hypothetical protein
VISAWRQIKAEIAAEKGSHSHRGSSARSGGEIEEETYVPPSGSTETAPEEEEPAPETEAPKEAPAPETEAPEAAPAEPAPESNGAGGGITAG